MLKWIKKRSTETSTLAGIFTIGATIATIAGEPELGSTIGKAGAIAGLILGGGLIGHREKGG
jgi:hypothetical protein